MPRYNTKQDLINRIRCINPSLSEGMLKAYTIKNLISILIECVYKVERDKGYDQGYEIGFDKGYWAGVNEA